MKCTRWCLVLVSFLVVMKNGLALADRRNDESSQHHNHSDSQQERDRGDNKQFDRYPSDRERMRESQGRDQREERPPLKHFRTHNPSSWADVDRGFRDDRRRGNKDR